MNNITLKFESVLTESFLENLFEVIATVLPSDVYTENKIVDGDGVVTDYNVAYHNTMGYHCYEMPITRELTIEEGKALYYVVDNAIDGDYFLEMPASATELQNRYKFKSFEGTVQEGEIQ
jgi:hypothetical protein|tara:strand:+ start:437 stop:796 length:360 start_codon:yes stop_codon:yes gene_type:complete